MEFRPMRRSKQELSREECIEILMQEPRGVLSVLGEGGYPYGMPINQYYCPENGRLYFHTAREGHRLDAIRAHDKVSLCVYDQGYRKEGEWALNIRSVIVFGRIQILEDHAKAIDITRTLSYKYTQDTDFIENTIRQSGANVLVFRLVPEHITGKLVNES